MNIVDFPNDLLFEILLKMKDNFDFVNISLVCKKFKELINRHDFIKKWKSQNLYLKKQILIIGEISKNKLKTIINFLNKNYKNRNIIKFDLSLHLLMNLREYTEITYFDNIRLLGIKQSNDKKYQLMTLSQISFLK